MLFLVFLLIVLRIALESKTVQNYLVKKATNYLSDDLGTEVSIAKVDFSLFDKVVLDSVLIKDQRGDTLLFVRKMDAAMRSGILGVFQSDMDIETIHLHDARIKLYKDSIYPNGNAGFLSDYFSKSKQNTQDSIVTSSSKQFLLDVSNLLLHDVHVIHEDKFKGQYINAFIPDAEITGISFNQLENQLNLEHLDIDGLDFLYHKNVKEGIEPKKAAKIRDSTYVMFTAIADKLDIKNTSFTYKDYVKKSDRIKFENTIDFNDLGVTDIQMEADSFWMQEDLTFKGRLNLLAAKEKSGFTLEPSSIEEVYVGNEKTELYGMEFNTPTTTLGDSLEMSYRRHGYPSFLNFVDDVRFNGMFKEGSKISLEDIFAFAPEMQNNRFFKNHKKEVLEIEGVLSGKVNNLKTKGLYVRIGNRLSMRGDMRTRNLAEKGEEFFDFELERLSTSMQTLRELVPDFNPPAQFDNLGRMNFKGRFTGFLTSFTANGFLSTDIGDIRSDISLQRANNTADYSGSLDLINFDLATWTGNPDFGIVNFTSTVKNGSGLKGSDIRANLDAAINSFSFRGYEYKLLDINGAFEGKKFLGDVSIKDDNIDLIFDGEVNFNDKIPIFNFKSQIRKLKLKELNLTQKEINISADSLKFNFKGIKIDELDGNADILNLVLQLDTFVLELDTLHAYSYIEEDFKRKLGIESEVLTGDLIGKFEINELPKIMASYAQRNFPKYTNKFDINPKLLGFNENRYFKFDFFSNNTKNLTKLISPQLDTIFKTNIEGYFDSSIDTFTIILDIDRFTYGDFKFTSPSLNASFLKDYGFLDLGVYRTLRLTDSLDIPFVAITNEVKQDTFNFQLGLVDFNQVLDKLNLQGALTLDEDNLFKINFKSSNMVILNHEWEILKNNFIRFGKGKIETQNFKMTNLDDVAQQVELNSINEKGLELSLQGLGIELLNDYIKYDKLVLGGPAFVNVSSGDIFKLDDLKAEIVMDSTFINGDYFGSMEMFAIARDLKDEVITSMELKKGNQKLSASGKYRPPYMEENPNYLDLNLFLKNYPLEIAEYFIGTNVSNTSGLVDANLKLEGNTSDLDLTGTTEVSEANLTIDYLQTSLHIPDGTVYIKSDIIDLSNLKFYDKEGNEATATGGITKNGIKDFGLDISLISDQFIALDTKEDDNEMFFGKGIGEIEYANFTGDFANTDMSISAKTLPGTKIFLPISSSGSGRSELSFITFSSKDSTEFLNQFVPEELRGLDLELRLEITPDAEIQLVIDENAGDILKGRGSGILTINVNRDGDFTMRGTYTVDSGNYLFTLLNVINKPFVIKKGGTITWTGDPLAAVIDLEASYDKLSTTPYNFILEYLNEGSDKSEAQRTTPIDLSMKLQGELFSPEISFDIGFPNLRGRTKTYTDSKLRIIKEDENELNRQVLGLIAFGSFFPSDMAYSNSGIVDGGINTLSELLSNQLSIYLNELLSEVITDVDIDFNYRYYELTDIGDIEELKTGSELEIRLKKGLFNNRLVINAGSNFDIDGGTDSGAFLAGDLLIEYLLTPDGRFKIRFYSESDLTISGRRNQTGVGVTYRKDFDKFSDLFRGSKEKKQNVSKDYKEFQKNLQEAVKKLFEM